MKIFLAGLIFLALALFLLSNNSDEARDNNPGYLSSKTEKNKTDSKKNSKKKRKQSTKKSAAPRKMNSSKARKSGKLTLLFWSKRLSVTNERESGYDRDAFLHWSDLDGNGCDTREDVLHRENLRPLGNCWSDRGLWYSAYDGVRTRNPSSFDVDHIVPLAEAYASGAWRWSARKKEIYANDKASLIAVSASSNREKSDGDPSEWLPPRKRYLCSYLKDWVGIKYRWRLSVDKKEKAALIRLARGCPRKINLQK